MRTKLWLYGPDYDEDNEGGAVAVVECCDDDNKWRMTGIVANCDYTTASDDYDGVVQLVVDIKSSSVHRRRDELRRRQGIERVDSETYNSYEDADRAARQWLERLCIAE